jgi:hypothetical protein
MVTFLARQPGRPDVTPIQVRQDLVFERSARIAVHCERIHNDTVDLTSHLPGLVNDYISLLLTNSVRSVQSPPDGSPLIASTARSRYMSLSMLYLFCVEMDDPTSVRMVSCVIVDLFDYVWLDGVRYIPGNHMISHVYVNSSIWDPLRQFLADCYIDFANGDWYAPEQDYHPDFIKNVLLGMLVRRDLPKWTSRTTRPRNYIASKEPEKSAPKPAMEPAAEPTQ